tara:strand:+ start:1118 stop:1909 length:792 start_codon:yes stop_codon:yes gene_type:complete
MIQNENPGFSFVVPTEFVELPTGGRYYPENHPLHNQESIEIKQMTAKEEDMLTSQTLLRKGLALERVLSSLIMDKSINTDTLFVADKNAIIIATRISGYGNEYLTNVNCPQCTVAQKYSFDLNSVKVYNGEDRDELGVTDNDNGTFSVILPKTEVNVTFRLLTGHDEKLLVSGMEKDKKSKTHERNVTRQIAYMVLAVNGDSSPQSIQYFVENIPAIDARHLRTAYKAASPNIDLTQTFVCSECDHEQDMEVPLNADFFWPDQ